MPENPATAGTKTDILEALNKGADASYSKNLMATIMAEMMQSSEDVKSLLARANENIESANAVKYTLFDPSLKVTAPQVVQKEVANLQAKAPEPEEVAKSFVERYAPDRYAAEQKAKESANSQKAIGQENSVQKPKTSLGVAI